ncbi:hypothetical protein FBZ87_10236 [Nitrospirillum amazonense]|uniref:Uncharacterized protein n=1 Tax=Nitrospirillum amazonense TaxID=28077 RepID=A0A560K8E8_9PROT|nr:hypothetical protein [Nitrospirillum amazonense]TWB79615.1 hypothetical protein FBZ87_10236 [Nitrospirillum amazonense]
MGRRALRWLLRIALWLCLSVVTAVILLVLLWKAAELDQQATEDEKLPIFVAMVDGLADALTDFGSRDPVYVSLDGRIFPDDLLREVQARQPGFSILSCPPTSRRDRRCAEGYRDAFEGDGPQPLVDVTRFEIPLWHLAQVRYTFHNGSGERILIKAFGKWRIIHRWDVHVLVTKILDEDDDESPAEDEAPKQLKVPRGGP